MRTDPPDLARVGNVCCCVKRLHIAILSLIAVAGILSIFPHRVVVFAIVGAPTMGQLTVAMPRTNYKGAFGTGAKEASCSQLIGCSSSEDQMLAHQMASRLSTRSGMAIYVSCQLSSSAGGNNVTGFDPDGWDSGLDSEMISHRAASLAEKEVWRILQNHQQQTS